jgi:hypothetical protein
MSWGGLVEMFNPGHRHLREEMDRKRVEAQIPGNEGDGTTQVDLENNVVRIPQPRPTERSDNAAAETPEDAADDLPQDE